MSTAFLTDKYELTMLDAALASGVAYKRATFEVFARKLPAGRRYGVVAGTDRVLEAVKNFRFTAEQIDFLRTDGALTENALDYLSNYSFRGKITGYAEGDLYFPNSPILTVDATFADAVLLETVILSIFNYDCAVASAASRMVVAARGTKVVEMGSRRANEYAAVAASRAAYIAGFAATSNLEAGHQYGIPTFGTSAHAFTLAHHNEVEAFEAQVDALGKSTTLLVDTYDTEQGIRNAVQVAGSDLGAVRIDSGDDFYEEVTNARTLLDSLGATNTKITISSDLDEFVIDELTDRNAPVDSFGAGTRVVTGSGAPTAGMVYKLVAIEDEDGSMRPVAKNAHGKRSVGGRKQAWRVIDSSGYATHERVVVRNNDHYPYTDAPDARALQHVLMENGDVIFTQSLDQARIRHQDALSELRPADKAINAGTAAITA